jgi:hypothetical protein
VHVHVHVHVRVRVHVHDVHVRVRVHAKTVTVTLPHHARVSLSKRRQHHLARSTCADALGVRSSPLGADTMCKYRNSFADALFTQGLMALMQPIVCCVRAQSAREFVTEFSGGATPHRNGVAMGVAQS